MLDEASRFKWSNHSVVCNGTIYTQHRINGSLKVQLEGLTNLNHTDCKSGRDKEPVPLSRPTPLLQINSKPLIAKVLRIKPKKAHHNLPRDYVTSQRRVRLK